MRHTHLDEDVLAFGINPLEGVAAVTAHEAPSDGGGVVRHEHHSGMLGLRDVGEEVEPRIVINQEVFRMTLLRPT
jgi:hypothetical protein